MKDKKKANTKLYPEFAEQTIVKEKINKKTKQITYEEKNIKKPLKYDLKHKEGTKQQRIANLYAYMEAVLESPPPKIELYEQIAFEKENLGYAYSVWEMLDEELHAVIHIDSKYTPKITLYQLNSGIEVVVKVNKKKFWKYDEQMLYVGDIIRVLEVTEEEGWRKVNNKWARNPLVMEKHLQKCKLIRKSKSRNTA